MSEVRVKFQEKLKGRGDRRALPYSNRSVERGRNQNVVGLEPAVGFLHDFSNYQTKQSLAYDLQEPFRWLVDLAVVESFESGTLDLKNFYFTGDDYRYRFEAEAKQRLIDVLRERLNSGVRYKGRVLKWDTVVHEKTQELARFLAGKSSKLDFNRTAFMD